MKKFNEYALLAAMCEREQDAKDIKKVFRPEWLRDVELQPVLRAIYEYIETQDTSPSIDSLSQFMEEKDADKFKARWHATLEQVRVVDPKTQSYNVARAKEAAATYHLKHLLDEERFQKMLGSGDAKAVQKEVSLWLSKHTETPGEALYSLQEAFDHTVDEHPWKGKAPKISTGIKPIDDWYGGIRDPQLGIIMAPTGHGKSAILMNIARHAASIEGKTVLFITNELTIPEQTERFIVRMQHPTPDAQGKLNFVPLNQIQDNPVMAYRKLEGYQAEISKHLYLFSANLGQDANGIEEVIRRLRIERGVSPHLVVVDYLERMSTVVKMDRGATWTYFGQIGKELVSLGKRQHCAIWTAIQTNRGGMNAKADLGMDKAQGSVQHIQEASLLVSARKVQVTTSGGIVQPGLEFVQCKARHGAMEGLKMIVKTDLSLMYISDEVLEDCQDVEEDNDNAAPNDGKLKSIKGQAAVKGKV